jgi:hypothetical protein
MIPAAVLYPMIAGAVVSAGSGAAKGQTSGGELARNALIGGATGAVTGGAGSLAGGAASGAGSTVASEAANK